MTWFKCTIQYMDGRARHQVVTTFEAKNINDARARAKGMYADVVRVNVCITAAPH